MAYICEKKISCSSCKHYRYDEEYDGFACFAAIDGDDNVNKEKDSIE